MLVRRSVSLRRSKSKALPCKTATAKRHSMECLFAVKKTHRSQFKSVCLQSKTNKHMNTAYQIVAQNEINFITF
jgi:hypothetical protein